MAAGNGLGKLQLLTAVMVLFMLLAVAVQGRKHVDKDCYNRCSSGCPKIYRPPGIRAACLVICLKRCEVQQPLATPDEASGNCVLSCENTMSSNFSSADVDKVKVCVDSCAEKRMKRN